MSKSVCILLNNEFIRDNRVRREAESLVNAGYDVTVIAVRDKSGAVPLREEQNGVKIERVLKRRFPNFVPFNQQYIRAFWKIYRELKPFDIVHANDANTLLFGWLLARLWKAKLVYDSHELWESIYHERAQELAENPKLSPAKLQKQLQRVKQMEKLENWLLERCDAVISVSPSICQILKEKSQGKADVHLVRNIAPYYGNVLQNAQLFHHKLQLPPETRIVLYQGGITAVRGINQLLDAMELIGPDRNITLVMLGPISPIYYNQIGKRILASRTLRHTVYYLEAVAPEDLLDWTTSAHLGIHPILNCRANHYHCLPNKLFEYIQAEIPVAVSNMPHMKQIVDDYQIGFTFDPENPAEMASRIQEFFDSPDQQQLYYQQLKTAKAALNWENEQNQLITLYTTLTGAAAPTPDSEANILKPQLVEV